MVLSPPCGMVTVKESGFELYSNTRSKPTVWDGDKHSTHTSSIFSLGSKPTVWDGDSRRSGVIIDKVKEF